MVVLLLAFGLAAMPAQAQDAQACHENAQNCETACAVGSLAGILLSRGQGDANKANAECTARCEAEKRTCLGRSAPAAPAEPAYRAPATAPAGPSVAECQERIVSIHRQSDADAQRYRNDALGMSRVLFESNRSQKALFEGYCANHPQAREYVATAEQSMREWGAKCVQFGGNADCSGTAAPAAPSSVAASSARSAAEHDPAGMANQCIRPNTQESYGGFTNTCSFPVSYIHCIYRPERDRHDTSFFNCERPGGLWAKSTTAGNLKPGQRDGTGMPVGGRIFWVACRDPYSIRDAYFDGNGMRAKCVGSGSASAHAPTPAAQVPVSRPAAPSAPAPQPAAGQDMAHCLKLERSSSGGPSLANHCGVTVEATWCTEGGSQADDCSRGFRNLWTIGAGRSYPVQGRPTRVRWGACKGANTLRGTGNLTYRCTG